jgi:hypothetical protein
MMDKQKIKELCKSIANELYIDPNGKQFVNGVESDEVKDFEKPFWIEYRAMVDKIEMLPACDQQTLVINEFHKFYERFQEELAAQQGISEIQQLIIALLKQSAQMLIDLHKNASIHICEPSTLTIMELKAMCDRLSKLGITNKKRV